MMNWEELIKKEFYIIDCKDFIYFVQPAHIVGIGGCASDEELHYYLDVKDFMGRDREMYMYELEKFKTFEEAQKEVDRLNNIPSNKKRAKQWNTKDKFMLPSYIEKDLFKEEIWKK